MANCNRGSKAPLIMGKLKDNGLCLIYHKLIVAL